MRKVLIKRVCLINGDTNQSDYITQDFLPTLSDKTILCSFYEVGKHVWQGHNMYKVVQRADGTTRYDRYEVFVVTQYVPSWYNNLIRKVRGW